jgi:hypothetical protein
VGSGHPNVQGVFIVPARAGRQRRKPAGFSGRGWRRPASSTPAEAMRARMSRTTCSGSESEAAERRASPASTSTRLCGSVPGPSFWGEDQPLVHTMSQRWGSIVPSERSGVAVGGRGEAPNLKPTNHLMRPGIGCRSRHAGRRRADPTARIKNGLFEGARGRADMAAGLHVMGSTQGMIRGAAADD